MELRGLRASGSRLLDWDCEGSCWIGHLAPKVGDTWGRSGLGGGMGMEEDEESALCMGHAGGGRREVEEEEGAGMEG